jgi:hypothetical protein
VVGIFFLWPKVDDNTSLGNCLVFGDVAYFIARKEKDGVSGFCDTRFPLGKVVELLACCLHPDVFEVGVMLEFIILCDGLFGDGMDDSESDFFNVDDGSCLL